MKRMRLENGSGHIIVTIECSPRTENNLMKDPELRTQLFSQSLTAEHRLEELIEGSPQMENEYLDHSEDLFLDKEENSNTQKAVWLKSTLLIETYKVTIDTLRRSPISRIEQASCLENQRNNAKCILALYELQVPSNHRTSELSNADEDKSELSEAEESSYSSMISVIKKKRKSQETAELYTYVCTSICTNTYSRPNREFKVMNYAPHNKAPREPIDV
ncbi:unnamed protein product [Ceratitis capitata]|uniref:(Mediterranean fruit fly) hypothetical protein n=1 Tax=Ceratitis capitata TaxID=7213 RepID=A0A811UWP9_CERCA|nr:unnamed protein product [Ceratitis capitata]